MDWLSQNIVFYDGDCGFCNKTVQFILKNERKNDLYFASLESEFAKLFFQENGANRIDSNTFYFYTKNRLFSKSSGAFALLRYMKLPFLLMNVFRIIPICYRDKLYDFVANRRKRMFSGFCYLPSEIQKSRFLN